MTNHPPRHASDSEGTEMVKHTPGPWVLEGNWSEEAGADLGGWVSSDHPRIPVFELNPIVGEPAEIIDNARLIAAAPDMLAALKAVVSIADRKTTEFDMARAAIAKAEGRS